MKDNNEVKPDFEKEALDAIESFGDNIPMHKSKQPPSDLDNIILADAKLVCNNYRDPESFVIGVGWGTAKTFLYYQSQLQQTQEELKEAKELLTSALAEVRNNDNAEHLVVEIESFLKGNE